MKLLLDECVTRLLKDDLVGHEVFTVDEAALKGLKNGALLQAAVGRFDVLVTVDRRLPREQHIHRLPIAIIVLIARSNRHKDLQPLISGTLRALPSIEPGEVLEISG